MDVSFCFLWLVSHYARLESPLEPGLTRGWAGTLSEVFAVVLQGLVLIASLCQWWAFSSIFTYFFPLWQDFLFFSHSNMSLVFSFPPRWWSLTSSTTNCWLSGFPVRLLVPEEWRDTQICDASTANSAPQNLNRFILTIFSFTYTVLIIEFLLVPFFFLLKRVGGIVLCWIVSQAGRSGYSSAYHWCTYNYRLLQFPMSYLT